MACGTCAFSGTPSAVRARDYDAVSGCSMLPLSFLAVSRPFTCSRTLLSCADKWVLALHWRTAGLPISWTVGLLHNFCCRGLILIPRPDSETSAQTTRVNVLVSFCKT